MNLTPEQLAIRRVVCAAIRNGAAVIIGPRHYDSMMHQAIEDRVIAIYPAKASRDMATQRWARAEQGFIDQWGNFLTRKEAWMIAVTQGQVTRLVGSQFPSTVWNTEEYLEQELYSENLY